MRDLLEVFGVFLLLVLLIGGLSLLLYPVMFPQHVCSNPLSVQCKVARVEECKALEQYTEDQCIALVGGGRP